MRAIPEGKHEAVHANCVTWILDLRLAHLQAPNYSPLLFAGNLRRCVCDTSEGGEWNTGGRGDRRAGMVRME